MKQSNLVLLSFGAMVISSGAWANIECVKPVASVSVSELTCKASGCQNSASTPNNNALSGLAQLAQMASGESSNTFPGAEKSLSSLITSRLQATGCFEIQDREALETLKSEMALAGKSLKLNPAKYVITGSITSIGVNTKKRDIAGGYIPNFVPVLGSMKQTSKSADLSLDIKILDVQNGRVLASKTFADNGENRSYRVSFNDLAGAGGAVGIKGTALEPLVSNVLEQIAQYSAEQIGAQEKGFAMK
ncbi:CsgG/HfaB family protein [Acinetobacter sp.]|jgi:curli biogenesis system outer membrane secretion channel CsgG|uniref:CsgG/HfaB family protein n=1 Tax=Acinetobacter sp. TaxID=472 RepID=UPI0035B29A4E